MPKAFKIKKPFGPREWAARLYRLSVDRRPVKQKIRRASVSGTTWPTEAIAIAANPRIYHNITYKH